MGWNGVLIEKGEGMVGILEVGWKTGDNGLEDSIKVS